MSRSGLVEDWDCDDNWRHVRWRGAVASAIRGKRGQDFLRELIAALDAMPIKELCSGDLQREDGQVCAIGCVAKARGIDTKTWGDVYGDADRVGENMGIAHAMAAEVIWANDECVWGNLPENERNAKRWQSVRDWAVAHLKDTSPPPTHPDNVTEKEG